MYFAAAGVTVALCWFVLPRIFKTVRPTIGLAVALIIIAAIFYGAVQLRQAEDQKQGLARAVSVLPPGAEEAWIAFVDRRFAGAIQRRGDTVRVATFNGQILDFSKKLVFGSGGTDISRNTPYAVSCDPALGGTVNFGQGDNSVMVPIYGLMPYVALMPIPIELKEMEAPPTGVDSRSIAASHLSGELCKRISTRLQEIMAPPATEDAR